MTTSSTKDDELREILAQEAKNAGYSSEVCADILEGKLCAFPLAAMRRVQALSQTHSGVEGSDHFQDVWIARDSRAFLVDAVGDVWRVSFVFGSGPTIELACRSGADMPPFIDAALLQSSKLGG